MSRTKPVLLRGYARLPKNKELKEPGIDALRADPDNRYVQALLLKVLTVMTAR